MRISSPRLTPHGTRHTGGECMSIVGIRWATLGNDKNVTKVEC